MKAYNLNLTDKFIYYCIVNGGNKELKSRKNMLECMEENSKDWKVISWISFNTLWRWEKEYAIKCGWKKGEYQQAKYYILCKGNRYYYVQSFIY